MSRSTWSIVDSTLFEDETWKAEAEEILANISPLNREVRNLEAPEGFEGVHSCFVEAVGHHKSFVSSYGERVDELDGDKIDRAINEMVRGSEMIGRASERIDQLME